MTAAGILHLLTEPLTIITASTTTNGYGDTVWAAGASTNTVGYLEQLTSVEALVDRDTVVSEWVVYLPVGTVVHSLDRVVFATQTFQVDGEPEQKWNPRTSLVDHIEARLTVVTG